jgi:uncharacterized protein (DUF305 family)
MISRRFLNNRVYVGPMLANQRTSKMKFFSMTACVAVVAAAVAGAASAQTQHQGHGGMPMMGQMDAAAMQKMMQDMMPASSDLASTKEFKEAHMAMMKNMHQPFTGNPDVDFRVHMIPHHQGAIDMAKVALKHAKDPDTKKMAQKIIDDQEREISEMRDWLKKNGNK